MFQKNFAIKNSSVQTLELFIPFLHTVNLNAEIYFEVGFCGPVNEKIPRAFIERKKSDLTKKVKLM